MLFAQVPIPHNLILHEHARSTPRHSLAQTRRLYLDLLARSLTIQIIQSSNIPYFSHQENENPETVKLPPK